MSAELERLREAVETILEFSAIVPRCGECGEPYPAEVKSIRAYIAALESTLARAQNPDGVRVVEVEDCGLCPCSTDLHLHSDLECDLSEEWKGYTEDGSPPDWCPLRSSPVLLRLKDGV